MDVLNDILENEIHRIQWKLDFMFANRINIRDNGTMMMYTHIKNIEKFRICRQLQKDGSYRYMVQAYIVRLVEPYYIVNNINQIIEKQLNEYEIHKSRFSKKYLFQNHVLVRFVKTCVKECIEKYQCIGDWFDLNKDGRTTQDFGGGNVLIHDTYELAEHWIKDQFGKTGLMKLEKSEKWEPV